MALNVNLNSISGLIITQMKETYESLGLSGKLFVETEQMFIKRKDLDNSAIYMVIKFGNASIDIAQAILPVYINAISKANRLTDVQSLMLSYSLTYNLTRSDGITQIYSTATNNDNFQEMDASYRATYTMNCSFVIGAGLNYIESIVNTESNESIKFLNADWVDNEDLKPQPYYSTGRTRSENQFTTHTISISTYPYSTSETLSSMLAETISQTASDHNTSYNLTITFTDGTSYTGNFKIANYKHSQKLATVPTCAITLTE